MSEFSIIRLPDGAAPQLTEMLAHWGALGRDGRLPGRQHFDPSAVPWVLPNIWLLDVHRDPLRFRFRLVGTAIVAFTGRDSTGRWADEVYPDYENTDGFRCARDCVMERTPQYRKSGVLSNPDRWHAVAERLYLPFANDGETVDMLLVTTVYLDQRPARPDD